LIEHPFYAPNPYDVTWVLEKVIRQFTVPIAEDQLDEELRLEELSLLFVTLTETLEFEDLVTLIDRDELELTLDSEDELAELFVWLTLTEDELLVIETDLELELRLDFVIEID